MSLTAAEQREYELMEMLEQVNAIALNIYDGLYEKTRENFNEEAREYFFVNETDFDEINYIRTELARYNN